MVVCEKDASYLCTAATVFGKILNFSVTEENLGGKALSQQQLLRLCHGSRERGPAGRQWGSTDVCQGKESCLCWIIGEHITSTPKSPFSNKTGLLFRDGVGKHRSVQYTLQIVLDKCDSLSENKKFVL